MNETHGGRLMVAALLSLVMLGGNDCSAEGKAEHDLAVAELHIKQGNWIEARVALARAEGRLGSGGTKELHRRLEQLRKDVELIDRLDRIRLGQPDRKSAAADRYAEEFRGWGIDVEKLSAEKAAKRIRDSVIREELLAALHDWAMVKPAGDTRKALLALADRVDDSPWRKRLRRAVQEKDVKALKEIAIGLDTEKQQPMMLVLLAEALRQANLTQEAIKVLRRGQWRFPADFWMNYYLAELLERQGTKQDDAVGFYRAALALRPNSPKVYIGLGSALMGAGKLEEAIASLRLAIALEPREASAHSKLGVALASMGKMPEAEVCYRRAIALDPANVAAHLQLGALLLQLEKVAEGETCIRNAIRLDSRSPAAHVSLGNVLAMTGRRVEAITCLRKAIELDPKNAMPFLRLGIILHQLGKLDEAIACYRKAIELDPKYASAHLNLGYALRDKGQLDEAIACYRKALTLQPNFAAAKKALEAAVKSKADR